MSSNPFVLPARLPLFFPARRPGALRAALLAAWLTTGAAQVGAQTTVCGLPGGNFALTASIPTACASTSNSNVQALLNELSSSGLQSLISSYNGTQVLAANADFNTTFLAMAYPNPGYTGSGANLTLSIPALGINQTFTGANRDVTKQELVDYLKSHLIGLIMKYQAAHSPISPIAGVGGLLQNSVAADFNQTFADSATQMSNSGGDDAKSDNLIGIGLSASSIITGGQRVSEATLPFSYTIRNDIDPRRQLLFALPITEVDANGAKSYQGGLGAAYRFPLSDNWSLTPGAKVSLVGSPDLATDAAMVSVSLMSVYVWPLSGFDLAMGNMLGYDRTLNLTLGGYDSDPDIGNTVLRNGLMLSHPVTIDGRKLAVQYSLIDTHYFGTQLYVEDTQELGISVGTNRRAASARSYLRGGLTILHGKGTKGVNAIIGYWF